MSVSHDSAPSVNDFERRTRAKAQRENAMVNSLPRRWCPVCERYLADNPAAGSLRTMKDDFGRDAIEASGAAGIGSNTNAIERMLEQREVPPQGSGIWAHRYGPGVELHRGAEAWANRPEQGRVAELIDQAVASIKIPLAKFRS